MRHKTASTMLPQAKGALGISPMLYYQQHEYATITFKGIQCHLTRAQSQLRC
jgi:hypothetical protein